MTVAVITLHSRELPNVGHVIMRIIEIGAGRIELSLEVVILSLEVVILSLEVVILSLEGGTVGFFLQPLVLLFL